MEFRRVLFRSAGPPGERRHRPDRPRLRRGERLGRDRAVAGAGGRGAGGGGGRLAPGAAGRLAILEAARLALLAPGVGLGGLLAEEADGEAWFTYRRVTPLDS